MKKIAVFLISFALLLMTGCGTNLSGGQNLSIEDYTWKFDTVQSRQKDGMVIACSDENSNLYAEANVIELSCRADDGVLLIRNDASKEEYEFSYVLEEANSAASIYKLQDDKREGSVAVSVTKREDAEDSITLVIQVQDFALYFHDGQ